MNNQHNTFYYFNDNTIIESKLIALEYEKITQKECKFFYHDTTYDSLNWKIEPVGSLQTHYINQAQRLRDNYDYLILCYSGGIDSTNILETYYYNNIKLDKIISAGSFSQDSFYGNDGNKNGEIYHNVFPYIRHLNLENIFQVFDYTKEFYNISNFNLFKSPDWIEKTGSWFSPNNWIWSRIHSYVVPKEYKNKKVAIIFGRDKPVLYVENQKYFFKFMDAVINSYGFFKGQDDIDVINFYWDPGYPDILLKQLHILKKFYDHSNNKKTLINANQTQIIGNTEITKLIYDLKFPLTHISPKSPSKVVSLRDNFLIQNKNSDVYEIFSRGVRDINSRINTLQIKPTFSKEYHIL